MADNDSYIPATKIEGRIAEIEREQERLAIERQMLERLRAMAVPLHRSGSNEVTIEKQGLGLLGPKQAILDLVGKHPGLKGEQVVEALKDSIDSLAKDRRRCIYSTIYTLKRDGKLKERRKKLYRPEMLEGGDEHEKS